MDNNIDIIQKSENEIKEDKIKDNINNDEEEEDSGDSFGIWFLFFNNIFYCAKLFFNFDKKVKLNDSIYEDIYS